MSTTKIVLIGIAIIVGLIVVGIVGQVIAFPFHVAKNEIQTGHDLVDKTINADNAIYNYEWFKSTKETIDAMNQNLATNIQAANDFDKMAGDRSTWTFEDKTESARLHAVAQGNENSLKTVIAEYNARGKMANRNIFENGLLPNFIDATTFIFKN
jgi:hypothetical protein